MPDNPTLFVSIRLGCCKDCSDGSAYSVKLMIGSNLFYSSMVIFEETEVAEIFNEEVLSEQSPHHCFQVLMRT